MPKNPNVKRVLVIGSGPIVIGQAAEFDYAGTQACRSLKEEGMEVILVNSNPATIMTDGDIADRVYIEPLTAKVLEQIILKEKRGSRLIVGLSNGHNLRSVSPLRISATFSTIRKLLAALRRYSLDTLRPCRRIYLRPHVRHLEQHLSADCANHAYRSSCQERHSYR